MLRLRGRLAWAALAAIIALQCVVMAYWASQKQNYHIDELYSFQYAHCFVGEDEFVYFHQSDLWRDEQWESANTFKEQLEVDDNSSVPKNLPEFAVNLFSGRNYNGLLNLAESIGGQGRVDATPGIVLNVMLFVLTQVVLFLLLHELRVSETGSLLAVLMYGSCGMVIGHVIFVRFYVLVHLLILSVLLLHAIMWNRDSLPVNLSCEAASLLLLYLSLKDSQLTVIVCLPLALGFSVGLLAKRRYRQFLVYAIPVFSVGFFYVATRTDLLRVLLSPAEYADGTIDSGQVRKWVSENLINSTPESVSDNLQGYLEMFQTYLFGSAELMDAFVKALGILAVVAFARRLGAGKGDLDPAEEADEGGHTKTGFMLVVLFVLAFYLTSAALAGLKIVRYLSICFSLLTVCLWVVLDWLAGMARLPKVSSVALLVLVALVAIGSSSPDCIEHLYPEDADLVSALVEAPDSIVLVRGGSRHAMYDCIGLCPEDASLYMVSRESHHIDEEEFPDEVLVWVYTGLDPAVYVEDLLDEGYELAYLGSDHTSDVYVCSRAQGVDAP